MGAALTYARRYALFTLVGIAGEDDLDAPDLAEDAPADKGDNGDNGDASDRAGAAARPQPASAAVAGAPATSTGHRTETKVRSARTVLAPGPSAALRDSLLADLLQLQSADAAADWAHNNLPAKNTLTAEDADAVEAGFRARLAMIEADGGSEQDPQFAVTDGSSSPAEKDILSAIEDSSAAANFRPGPTSPRRRPVTAKTIRLRDKEHSKFVALQPCVVCGRTPSEAHHIRFAQPRALGRKVSDEYTIPLCRLHHRDLHRYGDEASWWAGIGVDPLPIASDLWRRSHPSIGAPTE